MTKKICIVLFAVILTACSTAKLPPMDDAYYWSEQSIPSTQNTQRAQNTQNTQSTPTTPAIEYVNVQDTTVTIRIRR